MRYVTTLEHEDVRANSEDHVVRMTKAAHMHDSCAAVDDEPVAAVGALHAGGHPGRHLRAPLLQLRGAHRGNESGWQQTLPGSPMGMARPGFTPSRPSVEQKRDRGEQHLCCIKTDE